MESCEELSIVDDVFVMAKDTVKAQRIGENRFTKTKISNQYDLGVFIVDEENVDWDWPVVEVCDSDDSNNQIVMKAKMGRVVRESQKERKILMRSEGVASDQCKPTQGGSLHLVRLVASTLWENRRPSLVTARDLMRKLGWMIIFGC